MASPQPCARRALSASPSTPRVRRTRTAGRLGAGAGLGAAFLALAVLAACGTLAAVLLWRADDAEALEHEHHDLRPEDPHLTGARPLPGGGWCHRHVFVVDDRHRHWPS